MREAPRRRLLLLLKAGLSLGILSILAARTDFAQVGVAISALPAGAFIVAVFAAMLQSAIGAYRWVLVMSALRVRVQLSAAVRATYVSLLLNQCVPSYIGGDSYRAYWLYREGSALGTAVRGVLIDRVSATLALVVVLCITIPFVTRLLHDPAFHAAMIFILVSSAAGTLALFSLDLIPLPARVSAALGQIRELSASSRVVLLSLPGGVAIAASALIVHLLTGFILYRLATGMGIPLALIDSLLLVAPIALLAALPISIAGWGVREGTIVAVLSLLSVPKEQSLALSLLFGVVGLLNGLLGLFPLLLGGPRFFPSRPAIADPTTGASQPGPT